jgi:hypothetical protein
VEQIITSYRNGVSYPLAGRDELAAGIPSLKTRFPTYKAFGASRIEDIIPSADLQQAQVRDARTFASAVALNNGNGTFSMRVLPAEAQVAPIYASLAGDFDGDGNTDLLVGGNLYGVAPVLGRYDASYGLMLRGDGEGNFAPVERDLSNLAIDGEVRDLKPLRGPAGQRLIAVARNNDRVLLLRASSSTAGVRGATQKDPGGRGGQGARRLPPPAVPGERNTSSHPPRKP